MRSKSNLAADNMKNALLWLTVLIAPFAGLIVGTSFKTRPGICWENRSQHQLMYVYGFVDEGTVLLQLVLRDILTHPISVQQMVVEGLDARTGHRVFEFPVPFELLQCSWTQLVKNGTAILFLDSRQQKVAPENQLVLYDWRKQQIIKRYRTDPNVSLTEAMYQNGTMVACAYSYDGSNNSQTYTLIWQGDENKPVSLPYYSRQKFLSTDGALLAIYSHGEHEVQIVDVKKQKTLQKLSGMFNDIYWLPGNQQFVAIQRDLSQLTWFAKTFTIQNGQYEPDARIVVLSQTPNEAWFFKQYLMVKTNTQFEKWRKQLQSYLGVTLSSVTEYWWPAGSVRQLHDAATGELLQQIVLPHEHSRSVSIPHPNGNQIVLFDEEVMQLWSFPTAGNTYPLTGLLVGLVASSWLSWRWLKQRQRALQAMPTAYLRRHAKHP